jgi:putative colanic acid biosynthesis acetyltransferase WcaF
MAANRAAIKYSGRETLCRMLWSAAYPFFRFSPRPFFAWRRLLLRMFGATVGRQVNIYSSARIYFPWHLTIGDWSSIGEEALIYNLGKVTIGRSVTISQRAHLCAGTHDYTRDDMPLLKLPIRVNDRVWICADAFLGPNITIGEGAVVGARAVVVRNVEAWDVVAGNPARKVKARPRSSSPDGSR